MSKQLTHLEEELANLKILYENAVFNIWSTGEIAQLNSQIKTLEAEIESRQQLLSVKQNTN